MPTASRLQPQPADAGFLPYPAYLTLLRRLKAIPGPPLRIDPRLLEPCRAGLQESQRAIRDRYGIDLQEDWSPPEAEMIASEDDLLRFSPGSLQWLAEASRCPPIRGTGMAVAAAVAEQLRILGYSGGHRLHRWTARQRRWCWPRQL